MEELNKVEIDKILDEVNVSGLAYEESVIKYANKCSDENLKQLLYAISENQEVFESQKDYKIFSNIILREYKHRNTSKLG